MPAPSSTVGRIILDTIRRQGVGHVFCVPGESYLGLLDAFHDAATPTLVTTRHEEGAGGMAEAQAKLSGRPGVAMVTRGPGITHLSIAVHTAMQDGSPLVVFVGQVPRSLRGRGAFQEVDVAQLGNTLGKWGVEIDDPDRAAATVGRAFEVAQAGRPGPVLVAVPEDLGSAPVQANLEPSSSAPLPEPDAAALTRAAGILSASGGAAVIAGEAVAQAGAQAALAALASRLGAPVYNAWRRFDAFPNDHRLYAGPLPWLSAEMLRPLRAAQTLIVVGTRLDDFTSLHYGLPAPEQQLICIDGGRGWRSDDPDSAIHLSGDCRAVLEELNGTLPPGPAVGSAGETPAHGAYLEARRPPGGLSGNGAIDLAQAFVELRQVLPADTVTTCDAGAFTAFLSRYFCWTRPGTFVGATSGAMGYAVPAAIGAKLLDPSRPVVAFAGDGGFAMVMSEIETAVRLRLGGLLVVVFDNGSYGAIRRDQRRRFPGREVGVDLGRIDYAEVAEAMGAAGYRVGDVEELLNAVRSGLAQPRPAVIHATVDPAQLDAWPLTG
ncbi:MAG: thiamine pyrophosphate-dependent enzyme [Candidatus Dormibacteraceae bacterium]